MASSIIMSAPPQIASRPGLGIQPTSNRSNPPKNIPLHWSQYSFVQIVIFNIPPQTSTLNVYENFKPHGNISRINIFDTQGNDRGTRAEVRFEYESSLSHTPELPSVNLAGFCFTQMV
jgi:hypothetical protein